MPLFSLWQRVRYSDMKQGVPHTRLSCPSVAVKYFDNFTILSALHSKSKFWIEEECSKSRYLGLWTSTISWAVLCLDSLVYFPKDGKT